MSLEFVIIPLTSVFITTAQDIQNKLKTAIKTKITIQIDTNYDILTRARIQKWKKQQFNVITIDNDYNQANTISVLFSEKRSRPEVMEVEEFIDLVASFEDKDQHNIYHTRDSDDLDTDNSNGGCTIM